MLRGVIFDFDGVLVDSERAHFEGFRVVLAERAGFEITFHEYTEHYLAYDDHSGMRHAAGAGAPRSGRIARSG